MANSRAVVTSTSKWSESFITELLPAAEKTALLYHLSYLCLANFPSLEGIIRSRALETQLLFGSSEVLLLKCISTSKSMVESLFPMIKAAVEKDTPTLDVTYLENARGWITEIINNVDERVEKYDKHNKDVANSTSDVITTKDETDKMEQTQEVKEMDEAVAEYRSDLDKIMAELATVEGKIETKTTELEEFVSQVTSRNSALALVTAVIPFLGAIIGAIQSKVNSPDDEAKITSLENEVCRLTAEKTELRSKEWGIQCELIDWQMKLTMSKMEKGSIPSPEHLKDVQESLSRIVQILIELNKFWERIGVLLDHLEQMTFVGGDLEDFKEEFLDSLVHAAQVWNKFGVVCHSAERMFSVQSKDAYKFLEVGPASLSPEQWKEEYDSVKEKLKKISPAIEEPAAPAVEPAAPTTEAPAIAVPATEEPATSATEEPAASAIEEPAAPATEEPATAVPAIAVPATEEPAAAATEQPAVPAIEEPATEELAAPAIAVTAAEEPAAAATEQPAVPAIEEPATEEPAAPAIAVPAIEEPAAAATEQPAVPAIEEPATEEPAAPAIDQ